MAKLYKAIHEVHITAKPGAPGNKDKGIAPKAPVVDVTPPGGTLSLDPESTTCKQLLAAGAIEVDGNAKANSAKKTPAKKTTAPKKAPAKKEAPKADADADADEDLM